MMPEPEERKREDRPREDPARRGERKRLPRLPMGESFTVRRTDLLRELTKRAHAAGAVMLVAPRGFGKTALLLQYADEVTGDPSRGVARVIDAEGLGVEEVHQTLRECREEMPPALRPLVAVDNVPRWDERGVDRFVRDVRVLRSLDFEVVVACTPANRALQSRLGDAEKIGSQLLKVRPREYATWMRTFSIAGDLDVYELTQGVPGLVAALSAVVQGTGAASALEVYTGALYEDVWGELAEGSQDALRAAGMMLLMGEGSLGELEASGIKVPQEARVRFVHDYPVFGLDAATGRFTCLGRGKSSGDLHRMVSERFADLPAKAVRALMRSGRVDAAVALADGLLDAATAFREIGRFPSACALAGQGGYVARVATAASLADPSTLPSVGSQVAHYAAALTLGDFKTARALATELAVRAGEIEEEVAPVEWANVCALRGVWATCPGLSLPSVRFKRGGAQSGDAARKIRLYTANMRSLLEGKVPREVHPWPGGRCDGRRGEDAASFLPDLFARCGEMLREAAMGEPDALDERDAELEGQLEKLRVRRLAPVLMLVRLVVAMRRVFAGKPVVDERSFPDAGTMAIRTSDQPLQLFCLVMEGWQYLAMDQMVNAHFRAQQVTKLSDRSAAFVRDQAIVLERISHICNTSRVALSEEAEVIDLSRTSCRPSEAWATALSLAAVRFDAELAAWMSLHKHEMLEPGVRGAARLALRALGERAGSIVRLIPAHLQALYQRGEKAVDTAQRLFEVVDAGASAVVGQVTIKLFGGMRVERNGHVLTSALWRRRKTAALAARLALAPGAFVTRSALQGEFWEGVDYDHARNSLYSTLSLLRRALGQTKEGPQYVLVQGEGISLNLEYVVTDIMRFEMIAREVLLKRKGITAPQIIDGCLKIEQLYAGPLYVPEAGSGEFFEQMREAYRMKFVDCMLRGVDAAIEEGDLPTASWMIEAALAQAPLREDVTRAAMRVFERGGRRREVVELYRRHIDELRLHDRGIPEPETRALYDRIMGGQDLRREG